MSDQLVAEPRSRRAILAALGGGLVALAAQAIGRPLPVRAGVDGDVVLGERNPAVGGVATETSVNTLLTATAFRGESAQGVGLKGVSTEDSSAEATNTGVYGIAGDDANAAEDTRQTGVYGFAEGNDLAGIGVWGDSAQSIGVIGTGGDSGVIGDGFWGVIGQGGAAVTGTGVVANGNTGLWATTGNDSGPGPMQNTAVSAFAPWPRLAGYFNGRTSFSRSGALNVTAGRIYAQRSGLPLYSSSLIFAVVRTNRSGFWVTRAVGFPNLTTPTASYFRVYLNATVPAGVTIQVAYFILG